MRLSTWIRTILPLTLLLAAPLAALPGHATPVLEQAGVPASDGDAALQTTLAGVAAALGAGVTVEVRGSIVRLSGEVADPAALEQLRTIAGAAPGVLAIIDDATVVAPDVATTVGPLWARGRALGGQIVGWLPLLGLAIVLMFAFALLARLIRRWDAPFARLARTPMARTVLQQVLAGVIMMIGVVTALEILNAGAVIGAVLGTAGVFGIAVGFALQDLVENYIAGMLLGLRRPFALGDVITVSGETGKVVGLTLRETELMTFDGNHVRVPNAAVFKAILTNFTRNPRRRFDFVIGVGPAASLVPALELAVDVLASTQGVLADPEPIAIVEGLGDWTVNLHCYAWVDQTQAGFLKTKSRAIRRVKEAFDAAAIDMPNPTVVVQQPSAAPTPNEQHAVARERFVVQGDTRDSPVEAAAPVDPIDATIAAERARQPSDLLS